ncbi:MAG: LysR family transcriptional regulator [Pseudomonadota bacterium]
MPEEKNSAAPGKHWTTSKPRIVEDWEAAHIFLEVARSGSFRAASQSLGQSVNALRRKVGELEKALDAPLLLRHVNGVRLTQEGSEVYEAALQMEKASFSLLQAHDRSEKKIEGDVRLASTEGLGIFWILPKLIALQRVHPKLVVNLTCGMKSADILRLEADLAIQLERPQSSDLKVTRLGRMHVMLFAAQAYIARHGHPQNTADFSQHRFVVQSDSKSRWNDMEKTLLGESRDGVLTLRNNSSIAHFWSVVKGAGIGALPTYCQALGASLVPVNPGNAYPLDIWLTYHPDAKRIARVQSTIDLIQQAFDPRKYPWFRDEFIHPDELLQLYKGEPLGTIVPNA